MGRRKKIITQIKITGIADKGMAVGRAPDGRVVFVEKAVPGDELDALILRKKKGVPFGTPSQFHQLSEHRREPFCAHFGLCGGCKWQNLSYEEQVKQKELNVYSTLARVGHVEAEELLPILPCEKTSHFRNKLEFTFTHRRWLTDQEVKAQIDFDDRRGLGFHKPGGFDQVVDLEECHLQENPSNQIRNSLKSYALEKNYSFFNIKAQHGFLRLLLIRTTTQGDCMVILVVTENAIDKIEDIANHLISSNPSISSFYYIINQKKNDSLGDQQAIHLQGEEYIEEKIGNIRFKIGPKSFFQTNPYQTETLYNAAIEFADIQADDVVWDLYCGLGSITLYAANKCKKIIGIEEVDEAIMLANKNAELNNITNADFYCADVLDALINKPIDLPKPDIIITDPPRAGMHEAVVHGLIKAGAKKIIYISCNPATQARDLKILKESYSIRKVQPVDMFPHSHHIENIALLQLKETF